MEIKHRICFSPKRNSKACEKLRKLGIKIEEGGDGKIVQMKYFDIYESDLLWPKVEKILVAAGIGAITTRTEFTNEEIADAEWVLIWPGYVWGYPMPDLDGSWINISFNAGKECSVCGIGREQVAPIHMKGEPRIGENDFMGINWTLDLFSRPEVIDTMFREKISGFEEMQVIHYKSMEPLNTVKQLRPTHELPGGIIDDNLTKDCPACGHVKYIGLSRGMYRFSKDTFVGAPDLVRSQQWFGSGRQASQLVLASSAFVDLYLRSKWKGLCLAPIELL